jgi:hypothetical protein
MFRSGTKGNLKTQAALRCGQKRIRKNKKMNDKSHSSGKLPLLPCCAFQAIHDLNNIL